MHAVEPELLTHILALPSQISLAHFSSGELAVAAWMETPEYLAMRSSIHFLYV